MPKICPECGLRNTIDAGRCDCGHDFKSGGIGCHGQHQSARPRSWRSVLRWLVSIAFIGLGVWSVIHSSNVVLRGTPIPIGYLFLFVGGLGIFGCLFGVNVFRGGPLDLRKD